MTFAHPGQKHIARAERLLSWAHVWLDELRDHGRHARMNEVERVMFAALHAIASSHDALASAANFLGRRDWCEQLHQTQSRDPLLRYLWLAQHVDASGTLVQWTPERSNPTTQVVDATRLQHITSLFFSPLSPHGASERLLMYAHGAGTRDELKQKLDTDQHPDVDRVQAAGLEIVHDLKAVALQAFDVFWGGRTEHVPVPGSHLGIRGEYGAADRALDAGIGFYRSRADELTTTTAPR